ncbi:hypothetical protein Dimus_036489 [Dionaea muscipula]
MRGRHSGQGRGIDSSYLSGDDSTAEHVDSGALHHGQYTPELSAGTPSHVPSSYASPDPPLAYLPAWASSLRHHCPHINSKWIPATCHDAAWITLLAARRWFPPLAGDVTCPQHEVLLLSAGWGAARAVPLPATARCKDDGEELATALATRRKKVHRPYIYMVLAGGLLVSKTRCPHCLEKMQLLAA